MSDNILRDLSRSLRKEFPACARPIKVSVVGSFLAVRIDDPEGAISVKLADAIMISAGKRFVDLKLAKSISPLQGVRYHFDGVVANWELAP